MNTPTPYAESPTIDLTGIDLNRAVNLAVSAHMNALAPQLAPLTWTLHTALSGCPRRLSGLADDAPSLTRWALALSLAPGPLEWNRAYRLTGEHEKPGIRTFSGSTVINSEATAIRVWCIVDEGAYDADTAAYRADMAARRAQWHAS